MSRRYHKNCQRTNFFMGQAELQPRRYTVEEYMELETQSNVRHEFYEGEIFAMAGGTVRHSVIVLNIAFALRQALRGKGCKVVADSVQLAIRDGKHYSHSTP